MNRARWLAFLLPILYSAVDCSAVTQDVDSDGDGLSDFQELHKYLTNPMQADSDGDGIADDDWRERREYQYWVRSVVQVMRPVTIDYLNDDYQDARLLDESTHHVELEVIHYPFNRVAQAIQSDEQWRDTIHDSNDNLDEWLQPGPTSDWTLQLRQEIIVALAADGIDVATMNDRQTVEVVSKWLLKRAEYQDGFSCFSTAFDEQGKPYVPAELKSGVGRGSPWTVEEQWEREISAAGMFRHRLRGSCSSSAIYLSGCLRAIGIPTRTILCIPIVDANDERELDMIQRLRQSSVRRDLLGALQPNVGNWSSHTYNEVWVGGRWRRLNYDRLGQNIYDPGLFGLMTHVATFRDWADARMSDTIGRRSSPNFTDHPFEGPNPYSAISLRDEVGIHCQLELPDAHAVTFSVEQVHWTDSPEIPDEIRNNCREHGRFGLIADVTGFQGQHEVQEFLAHADLKVFLDVSDESTAGADSGPSARQPIRLGVGFDPSCYWLTNNRLHIYVPFGAGDRRDLVAGASYAFRPRNSNQEFQWTVAGKLNVRRSEEQEKQ